MDINDKRFIDNYTHSDQAIKGKRPFPQKSAPKVPQDKNVPTPLEVIEPTPSSSKKLGKVKIKKENQEQSVASKILREKKSNVLPSPPTDFNPKTGKFHNEFKIQEQKYIQETSLQENILNESTIPEMIKGFHLIAELAGCKVMDKNTESDLIKSIANSTLAHSFISKLIECTDIEYIMNEGMSNLVKFMEDHLFATDIGTQILENLTPEQKQMIEELIQVENEIKFLEKSKIIGHVSPHLAPNRLEKLMEKRAELRGDLEGLREILLKDEAGKFFSAFQKNFTEAVQKHFFNLGTAMESVVKFYPQFNHFPENLKSYLLLKNMDLEGTPFVVPQLGSDVDIGFLTDYGKIKSEFSKLQSEHTAIKKQLQRLEISTENVRKELEPIGGYEGTEASSLLAENKKTLEIKLEASLKKLAKKEKQLHIIESKALEMDKNLGNLLSEHNKTSEINFLKPISDSILHKVLFPGGVPFDKTWIKYTTHLKVKIEDLTRGMGASIIWSVIDGMSSPSKINSALNPMLKSELKRFKQIDELQAQLSEEYSPFGLFSDTEKVGKIREKIEKLESPPPSDKISTQKMREVVLGETEVPQKVSDKSSDKSTEEHQSLSKNLIRLSMPEEGYLRTALEKTSEIMGVDSLADKAISQTISREAGKLSSTKFSSQVEKGVNLISNPEENYQAANMITEMLIASGNEKKEVEIVDRNGKYEIQMKEAPEKKEPKNVREKLDKVVQHNVGHAIGAKEKGSLRGLFWNENNEIVRSLMRYAGTLATQFYDLTQMKEQNRMLLFAVFTALAQSIDEVSHLPGRTLGSESESKEYEKVDAEKIEEGWEIV